MWKNNYLCQQSEVKETLETTVLTRDFDVPHEAATQVIRLMVAQTVSNLICIFRSIIKYSLDNNLVPNSQLNKALEAGQIFNSK